MSRSTLVALDAVSLIKSGLHDQTYVWLQGGGAAGADVACGLAPGTTLQCPFLAAGVLSHRPPKDGELES